MHVVSMCLTTFTRVSTCNPSHKKVIRREVYINICVLEGSILGQTEHHKSEIQYKFKTQLGLGNVLDTLDVSQLVPPGIYKITMNSLVFNCLTTGFSLGH